MHATLDWRVHKSRSPPGLLVLSHSIAHNGRNLRCHNSCSNTINRVSAHIALEPTKWSSDIHFYLVICWIHFAGVCLVFVPLHFCACVPKHCVGGRQCGFYSLYLTGNSSFVFLSSNPAGWICWSASVLEKFGKETKQKRSLGKDWLAGVCSPVHNCCLTLTATQFLDAWKTSRNMLLKLLFVQKILEVHGRSDILWRYLFKIWYSLK